MVSIASDRCSDVALDQSLTVSPLGADAAAALASQAWAERARLGFKPCDPEVHL